MNPPVGFLQWFVIGSFSLFLVLLLVSAAVWLYLHIRQFYCGLQGHETEHRVVIPGICFEIVCTKCDKQLYAGPYDTDPDTT